MLLRQIESDRHKVYNFILFRDYSVNVSKNCFTPSRLKPRLKKKDTHGGTVKTACQLCSEPKPIEFFLTLLTEQLLVCATTMITQVKPFNSSTSSPKEKVETEKTSLSSKWKVFASNTTLHGLRYVVQNGFSIVRRVTWLIFLCATASSYTYLSSQSFEKFMSRPIKTVISQETPSDGLTFPAVTICNLNRFMKTKIDMVDNDENFEKMGLNIGGCSETRAVRGNLTCGQALLCAFYEHGSFLVDNCNTTTRQNIRNVLNRTSERVFNKEQFFDQYGHDMAGMLFLFCVFSFKVPCSAKDFVPTATTKSICYTFNSGIYNSSRKQTLAGPEKGLTILLNVQTNESTLSDFSSGLQVIVHDQNTFANRNSGFNIFPGTHASVAVKLRKVSSYFVNTF